MERIEAAVQRDLIARMRLRIDELERENAELRAERKESPWEKKPGRWRYMTEAERLEARRRTFRESNRRRNERLKAVA